MFSIVIFKIIFCLIVLVLLSPTISCVSAMLLAMDLGYPETARVQPVARYFIITIVLIV